MAWEFEVTDTLGGEANYCWCERTTVYEELTDRQLVRRLKAFAGWTGLRCKVDDFGDMVEIRPAGICQVAFASWRD